MRGIFLSFRDTSPSTFALRRDSSGDGVFCATATPATQNVNNAVKVTQTRMVRLAFGGTAGRDRPSEITKQTTCRSIELFALEHRQRPRRGLALRVVLSLRLLQALLGRVSRQLARLHQIIEALNGRPLVRLLDLVRGREVLAEVHDVGADARAARARAVIDLWQRLARRRDGGADQILAVRRGRVAQQAVAEVVD